MHPGPRICKRKFILVTLLMRMYFTKSNINISEFLQLTFTSFTFKCKNSLGLTFYLLKKEQFHSVLLDSNKNSKSRYNLCLSQEQHRMSKLFWNVYFDMQKYSTSLSYPIALSAFREQIDKSGLATNHTIDFKQWCCHMTPNNVTQMHKG